LILYAILAIIAVIVVYGFGMLVGWVFKMILIALLLCGVVGAVVWLVAK